VQQTLEQVVRDVPNIVGLIQRFHRAVDAQNRRDAETIASMVRILRNPRTADAEKFVELLRSTMNNARR
jgi:hypothetical protein